MPDMSVDEFLAHYGIKGMHWGSRNSASRAEQHVAKTDRKIARTKARIEEHTTSVKNIKSHIKDANENGVDAELFKKKYGSGSNALFQAVHGMNRAEALKHHQEDLQNELSDHLYAKQVNETHLNTLQRRRTSQVSRNNLTKIQFERGVG